MRGPLKTRTVKAFQAPPEVSRELEAIGRCCDAQAGSILFQRGQVCRGIYVVLSGRVALSSGEDPIRIVRVADKGCLLGLPATVSGRPYSLTAEVVIDTKLSFVPTEHFRRLLVDKPNLGFKILEMLADEVSVLRKLTVYKL